MSRPVAPLAGNVIAFPSRAAPQAMPDPSRERLVSALTALDLALAEQRRAIAEWRASLAELGRATADLAGGLGRYRNQLDLLEASVGDLNSGARRLDAWADQALAWDPH